MTRLPRKNAIPIGDVLKDFIRANHLTKGLNTQLVFKAWDEASGAAKYTLRRIYRDGKLFITVDPSVVRSQLLFQKDTLLEKMNSILADDPLFTSDDKDTGLIKDLSIK